MHRLLPACFFLLVLTAACGGNSSPTSPDGPVVTAEVFRDKTSGVKDRRGEIISRESRWAEVWDEIVSQRSPKPPRPNVDFDSRILIFAGLGETADSCKGVRVAEVERRGGALAIAIAETRPPAGCTCPPMIVQPVHVVSVPRAATDATFQWRSVTEGNCE